MSAKVKVKIAADPATAAGLRTMVQKYATAELATSSDEVQLMAWLLEMAREINMAHADQMAMESDRGHEWVLGR